MKLIWTAPTAAAELGISKRHVIRYVKENPELRECLRGGGKHGGQGIYVFSVQHIERLRELVKAGPEGRKQHTHRRKTYERRVN